MNKILKVLSVYRYDNSGKLVACHPSTRTVLPLNRDLTPSSQKAHRISRKTEITETSYRIEFECWTENGLDYYRRVRLWDVNHLPVKVDDPSAPLENRIDITPCELFNDSENKYVGRCPGHPLSFWIFSMSIFPLVFWVLPITCASVVDSSPIPSAVISAYVVVLGSCLLGLSVSYLIWVHTRSSGNPQRVQEVVEAKSRVRALSEQRLSDAMRDIRAWDLFDGIEFERAVGRIYTELGFDVEFTPVTNDQGIDLVLRKQNRVSIVQCKKYGSNVGVAAVRELMGARADWPDAVEVILVSPIRLFYPR
jgi:hypothetical protein